MATYTELSGLINDEGMLSKVDVAIMIAAQILLDGTPSVDDRKWARQALYAPRSEGAKAWRYLLAKFNTQTTAVILAASNSTIQDEVDAVVPALVAGMAGS